MKCFYVLFSFLAVCLPFLLTQCSDTINHKGAIEIDIGGVTKKGWSCENMKIAGNTLLDYKTKQLLAYSDYQYFNLRKNKNDLNVLIVLWNPRDSRLRASEDHNPDICWVKGNGWLEKSRVEKGVLKYDNKVITPIEYRALMTPDKQDLYFTYFWHVWNGRISPLDTKLKGGLSYNWRLFSNFVNFSKMRNRIKATKSPRWFIRIHSKTPLAPVVAGERREARGEILESVQSSDDSRLVADPDGGHYLIDYPEVRELLRSIHELTTGEEVEAQSSEHGVN